MQKIGLPPWDTSCVRRVGAPNPNPTTRSTHKDETCNCPSLLRLLAGCAAFIAWPRPQDPRERPYVIEQVQFAGGDGVTLAGELTMPSTGGPFPAAILLSGSGPSDRNHTVSGHRPWLVLSDHLTKAGYAVLRYDD